MAGIIASAVTAEVSLTAATARTIIQVAAATNHRVRILGIGLHCDGTSPTAEPIKVDIYRQTTAGTMTALQPRLVAPATESVQTTAQHSATAEPTYGDLIDSFEVHPQSGYAERYPVGQEIIVPGGGRLGVVCTAPATVNAIAKIHFEE